MMRSVFKFILRFFAAWILLMAIILIVGDHSGKAGDIVFGSAVFALMIGLFLPLETGLGTEHVHHSRHRKKTFISCMKCGYLGVGSGSCPRCGWTGTRKITTDTSIISCRNCGYLGAGSGTCPRCGSTRAEIINK